MFSQKQETGQEPVKSEKPYNLRESTKAQSKKKPPKS